MEAIKVPHINPNEDSATIVALLVSEGDRISNGDVLFELETTKSAIEVTAETDGFLTGLNAQLGETRRVGEILGWIAESPDADVPAAEQAEPIDRQPQITVKARALADELGVEWQNIIADGIISSQHIRDAAESGASDTKITESSKTTQKDARIPVLIMGAGGHGKTVAEMIRNSSVLQLRGFVDPKIPSGTEIHGSTVVGSDNELGDLVNGKPHVGVVACGLLEPSAELRIAVFERCASNQLLLPPIVHPTAFVDPSAILGKGVQIHAGARVGADSIISNGSVINTNAVVSHDSQIGEHTHIAPGALIAGGVTIGARCLIGMGATIFAGVTIDGDMTINNGQDVFSSTYKERN